MRYINALKEEYKRYENRYNILLLTIVIILGAIFFKGHYSNLLTDFGREMIFPEAILQGKILYKDILCIYFPFAYQINALGFKFFGIKLSVLEYFGLINTLIFTISLYSIAKEFLKPLYSFLFTITVTICAAFNGSLFNLILPYSSSMSYGVSAYLCSVLFLIKYLKNNLNIFLNLAFLSGGLAFIFKSEFAILFLILLFTILLIKPTSIKKILLNIFLYITPAIISFGFLFIQGLSINELANAFLFMKKFFTTDSMIYHISRTGGIFRIQNFQLYLNCIIGLIIFLSSSFLLFKYSFKTKFTCLAILCSAIIANYTNVSIHTVLLPIITLLALIFNYKKLFKNKPLFILILSAIALNIRTFWSLIITLYGVYTAPLLVLALIVLIFEYSTYFKNELKSFIVYLLCTYLTFFVWFSIYQKIKNNTSITTEKGTIYLPQKQADSLNTAIKYIQTYTKKNDKILVLPEGSAINFLTGRPLDLKMPMVDRLYYDALGEEFIIEKLKSADYELILVIKGYGLTNFGSPYLYDENSNIIKFLKNNYKLDWETKYNEKHRENTLKCFVKPY